MSGRARSGRHPVMMMLRLKKKRRSQLLNQFRPVTVTARTTPETLNPRISTRTVTNRLRDS